MAEALIHRDRVADPKYAGGLGRGVHAERQALLKHELGDLLFAEKTILKGLKKMTREVSNPEMKARRKLQAEHPIERTGAQLRAMMPWIGANKLVDKAKN